MQYTRRCRRLGLHLRCLITRDGLSTTQGTHHAREDVHCSAHNRAATQLHTKNALFSLVYRQRVSERNVSGLSSVRMVDEVVGVEMATPCWPTQGGESHSQGWHGFL